MSNVKEWADAQWQAKGVLHAVNGNVFTQEAGGIRVRAGTTWNYTSKETKRRQKGLAMYNPKLRDIILAEATREMRNMEVEKPRKAWENREYEVKPMPHYTWPKETPPVEPAAAPRKRVSRKQVEAAAAILAKVPQSELAAFLSRFGLTLSVAVTIANASDIETMARQFLRAL